MFRFKTEISLNPTCVILTLAAVTRTSPSLFLWLHPVGVHPPSAPTQNGILDCALANHEESHRPACAAIR